MSETTTKASRPKKIQYDKSGYYFIGLVTLSILGFWPSYFSKFF